MRSPIAHALAALLGAALLAAPALAQAPLSAPRTFSSQSGPVRVEPFASGLEHPWGLAFLPDGSLLVTEKPGRLRRIGADGRVSAPLKGVPAVMTRGQGGLLDVALGPDFASSRLVYISYAEDRGGGTNATAVARGRLDAEATGLEEVQVIFRQEPAVGGTNNHFGSRLVFARDGALFVTLGERFTRRDEAQNPANDLGKLVRILPDGAVPKDNPLVARAGARPEIWSLGHRNVQGAALNPATGEVWTIEHGAKGGDEVNIPRPGRNYGWPVITYGVDYSGAKIGEGTAKPGLEQPVYYWDPSIAPSGALFYTGDRFPAWRGSLFTGGLAAKLLSRLSVDGDRVTGEERLLRDLRLRIRDVRQGPDGLVYLLTDEDQGQVLRLSPGT